MPPIPTPLALPSAIPSELLTYILTHQSYPTTLIICKPRAAFLSSLQRCLPTTVQRQSPPPPAPEDPYNSSSELEYEEEGLERELEKEREKEQVLRHPLLLPTLHQIATARHINLVFIPTLSHLRAYVTVFNSKRVGVGAPPEKQFDRPGKKSPLLVVYGLIELHRDTSEWSAQGLGSSVAAVLEAGFRGGRGVVVLEEKANEDNGGGKAWEERMPMLNGSVRRAGMESEDGGWSGRTIEVGRVLARWFRFGRGEWEML